MREDFRRQTVDLRRIVSGKVESVKIDRKALSLGSVREPSDEKAYWLSKTPQERLQAAELMR